MILTTISPDKTSLSMFLDFYKTIYDQYVKVFILNSLFSEEILKDKIEQVKKIDGEHPSLKFLIYKTKSKNKAVPSLIEENSDVIIKFDLFSYTPEVLKNEDKEGFIESMLERWNVNMARLNAK